VRTVTFRNLPKGAIRFTDCFGNDWKFVERKGEIVNVQLNPMPLFIWNERLSRSEFERLLKQAFVSPNPVYGGIYVLPNGKILTDLTWSFTGDGLVTNQNCPTKLKLVLRWGS
jgi:hypothetical protein